PPCPTLSPTRSTPAYHPPLCSPYPTSSSLPHSPAPPPPHSFPTRRSSDLHAVREHDDVLTRHDLGRGALHRGLTRPGVDRARCVDRKSTRLNSSHQIISYAVFCLKKKKTSVKDTWGSTSAVAVCVEYCPAW